MGEVKKRKIRWAISLFLVLYFYALTAQAQYGGGSGEPNDPYLIYTAEQMNAIGANEGDWYKHFKLMSDIDLAGFSYVNALIAPDTNRSRSGFQGTHFTGVFDGNGHTISHLTIAGESYLGLFGQSGSGAKIANMGLEAVNVNGTGDYVGGLVGRNAGSITTSYSTGTVSGRLESLYGGVGGLVGSNEGSITTSHSSNTVSGDWNVGGLVGWNSSFLTHCYSMSEVSGSQRVGGLVGSSYGGHVNACYSTGAVSGNEHIGGLVGRGHPVRVSNSFWDMETSGQATSAGGTGLTTGEMQDVQTYLDAGWDWFGEIENGISEIWQMPEGGGYPVLAVFSGYIPPQLQGMGTPDEPYMISDAMELAAMVYYSPDAHYQLAASIDLSGIRWGMAVIPWFGGTFDGNNLTISHMTIEGESYLGLFGRLGSWAVVKKLGVVDVNITGSNSYVGGLVGRKNSGSLLKCFSTGAVRGTSSVGGLVGDNNGPITNCYSTGSVTGTNNVGCLVGINYSGAMDNCYATCSVWGVTLVGGLVGYNYEGRITNCYATGSVSGKGSVGGLVGQNGHYYVDFSDPGRIANCYSTGAVSGQSNTGGLVGDNYYGTITGCFWDIQTSGQATSAGGMGKTTAEMQASVTFTDWVDCCYGKSKGVWTIDEGNDYPRLWWENAIGHLIEPTRECLMHATNPSPPNGTIYEDIWVSLSWSPGDCAASHRVYFGDNFDDVNDGTGGTFRGNRTSTSYVVGLPGFAYSDGLVPGTTYYWRIDEVNNMHPESPCKGDVWSFTVPHMIAYNPSPPDGAVYEDTLVNLDWSAGDYAMSHDVYFGDNFDDVNEGVESTFQGNQADTFFVVGFGGFSYRDGLVPGATYYWRVDEVNDTEPNSPWKGNIWSFWIPPYTAYNPNPHDGAKFVDHNISLSWTAGLGAKLHTVYFGEDFDAVNNAAGNLAQENTIYDPGPLKLAQTYYWRIDEVDNANPDSPWIGPVWSFTTANFIVVDDFESYNDLDPDDPASNRIFNTWLDGYDNPINGSLVEDDLWIHWWPRRVHSGNQSMPFSYDNSVGYSEATANVDNLEIDRDWTIEGVGVLSLWFHGRVSNAPEPLYVALANSSGSPAVVYHDNPNAALIDTWTEWNIYLQAFTDQGVDLTDVDTISIGFGDRNNPQAGGSGTMYFDDIRLYRPVEPEQAP